MSKSVCKDTKLMRNLELLRKTLIMVNIIKENPIDEENSLIFQAKMSKYI